MSRIFDLIKGLIGLALIVALVVGVPAALIIVVGFPFPTEMPSVEVIRAHIEDGNIPASRRVLEQQRVVMAHLGPVQQRQVHPAERAGLQRLAVRVSQHGVRDDHDRTPDDVRQDEHVDVLQRLVRPGARPAAGRHGRRRGDVGSSGRRAQRARGRC